MVKVDRSTCREEKQVLLLERLLAFWHVVERMLTHFYRYNYYALSESNTTLEYRNKSRGRPTISS